MTTLTEQANRYHSDKGDQVGCCHRYASLYESLLERFRQQPISFLEIGLQREFLQEKRDCPSLRMWLDYLPHATVNGFDISDFSGVDIPRARIFQGDQSDPQALIAMAKEVGPFDVIIEDGYHASEHQQVTIGTLFPHLNPGGLMIIEDAHWQPERSKERQQGINTTLEIFKRWAVWGEPLQSQFLTEQQCRDLERNIKSCSFSHPFENESGGRRPQSSSLGQTSLGQSALGQWAKRIIKGKKPQTDDRNFKLIILEKSNQSSPSAMETVTVHLQTTAR